MNASRINCSPRMPIVLVSLLTGLSRLGQSLKLSRGSNQPKVRQQHVRKIQPQETVVPLLLNDEDLIEDLMETLNTLAASDGGKTIIINENPHWLVEL